MTKCVVMLNGEMRECEIFKENTHTVWVYNPGNLKIRTKTRKVKPSPKDIPSKNMFQYLPTSIMLSMMPSIGERYAVEDDKIIKRHKRKHLCKKC